jgi:hypothetical protein
MNYNARAGPQYANFNIEAWRPSTSDMHNTTPTPGFPMQNQNPIIVGAVRVNRGNGVTP